MNADNENSTTEGTTPTNAALAAVGAKPAFNLALEQARRTAFVARFIVLREGKRTKAHRVIERMRWRPETTAEELYQRFRQAFIDNHDNLMPVDRDLRRALKHSDRNHVIVGQFIEEYSERATHNFVDALKDYGRSNSLLFGDDEQPKSGGWRLPLELEKEFAQEREEELAASKAES